MQITMKTLMIAGAAVSILACPLDKVAAGQRIVHVASPGGSTFGGRIVHVPNRGAVDREEGVKIVTPRYTPINFEIWEAFYSGVHRDFVEDHSHAPEAGDFTGGRPMVIRNLVVNRSYDGRCFSGGSRRFAAGKSFQAGGNMLRVPPQEAAYGRRACARTRVFQRYLGFKRVYKGQVYSGFRNVYSGKKYLTGDY